ncbi:unnamed protein product [Medioppia subpectinata]|uniref:RING-type E3 ubiquitin transferase n=1 Tax=Medioppia subpectinata TaxID=1979941 RepID=A0A7R9PZK2_9ACAR|nr:unnamed protein product [Medioppia subpectinata]CAG2107042.1 unnamed protein product [Medioppia subpectinata]
MYIDMSNKVYSKARPTPQPLLLCDYSQRDATRSPSMANSTRAVTDTGHVIAGTSTTAATDTGDGNITVTAVTADGYDSGGDDTPALRQEITRLRQLIDILDNIRIYSLPLINDCHCQRQSSPARLQKYRRFNAIYEDLKASHLRSPIKRNNHHPIIISGAIAAANDGRACSVVDTGGDDSTDITVEIVSVADDNDQQSDVDVVDTKHCDLNVETETDENEENIAVDPNPNVPPLTQWPPLPINTTATDSTCAIVGALYTCYECDHDFPTQLDLDVHTERIHLTGDEAVGVAVHSYVCDKCYEVFDTEDRLHRHFSQRHRTKRLFGCDQCPYKTLSEKYLLRHKAGYHSPRGSPARKASPYKSPQRLRSPPKLKHRSPQRSPQKSPRSVDTNAALVEKMESIFEIIYGVNERDHRYQSSGSGHRSTGGQHSRDNDNTGPAIELVKSSGGQKAEPMIDTITTGDQCPICLDIMCEPVTDGHNCGDTRSLTCRHRFHKKCLKSWFAHRMTCPVCRQRVAKRDRKCSADITHTVPTGYESDEGDEYAGMDPAVIMRAYSSWMADDYMIMAHGGAPSINIWSFFTGFTRRSPQPPPRRSLTSYLMYGADGHGFHDYFLF